MLVECLFTICNRYWAIVRQEAAHHDFPTGNEEIRFFKVIKPRFISEQIYVGYLNDAHPFLADHRDSHARSGFWKTESERLGKFKIDNESFCTYYESGNTEHDVKWFTRFNPRRHADPDEKTTTAKDHLVSTLLALERYHEYVSTEMTMTLPVK